MESLSAGSGLSTAVSLRGTPELRRFLELSAAEGLSASLAVRLGLERALVLMDAQWLALDGRTARQMLCAHAARARVRRSLTTAESAYIRALYAKRPVRPLDAAADTVSVCLPAQLVTRARTTVPARALDCSVVQEMLAWELAAALEARGMGEWALRLLAASSRAR